MAKEKTTFSPSSFFFVMLLLSFNAGGGFLKLVNAEKKWCVAKPSTDELILQNNIEFACGHVDCTLIQPGCPCYEPNNRINHASVVMNLYYQSEGRNFWDCDFRKSALTTISDPSYGSCKYEYK